jgi:hypothetical protein
MKKVIFSTMILAFTTVSFFCSCSSKVQKNDQSSAVIATLKAENDSLKKAFSILPELLTVQVDDTIFSKYCVIPDTIKKLFVQYKEAVYSADAEYETVSKSLISEKDRLINVAGNSAKVLTNAADKKYDAAKKSAQDIFFCRLQK